ncbi:MAG TPA: C25 family cysteine peptidase, partial [Candidatus Cloacimonadota bacterium]|nr:C25 family cysteine peptidase [Candidatus Cloacimonadota bacterium]
MHDKAKLIKLLMITVIIGLFTPLCAQSRTIQLSARPTGLNLHNSNEYGFDLRFTVEKYDLYSVETKAGAFDRIAIDGFGCSTRIGEAELPAASRIVAVPLGAEVSFEIRHQEKKLLSRQENGIIRELLPVQEPVSKSADYNSIVFAKDASFYTRSALSQNPTFRIEEIGMMRGMRLFQFYIEPVKYNPGTSEIEIVYEAEIHIEFSHPDLAASAALKAKTASVEFDALYAKTIMNYSSDDRSSLVRTPTKMLILCPPAYTSTMDTYITFKRKQGYIVNLVTVGSGGTVANTTSAITSYMQGIWNSATTDDPAPTYLIIVGDTADSGNNIIAPTGVTGSHPTDLTYVRLQGTDYLPELYFGRFSVTNTAELTNVINKTLMFAQTSMPDRSYLGKTVLIAGVDATYAPTHGNGAINYGTTHYFNSEHGITSNNYPYPASGTSASAIIANANEGRGYLNYTAHGSTTSWADPSFTVSDMLSLTNVNKPFVAVGNCCVTSQFTTGQCFGESVIRASNAGAAYIGGTNNTYWNEDFYWAVGYKTPQTAAHPYDPTKLGAYDAMFHAPSSVDYWAQTTGETVFMGNMAVQQSGSSRTNYYWEIYSIMGDPSLMPYYGVPTVNTATFPSAIMMGLSSINISAQAYSKVALSMNGTLYATGIVPASGTLTLSFTPFTAVGNADLVITCSGKITRQETIQVLPASGPYMTVDNYVYTDNNNLQPDYNESGSFNTTFKNAGANSATNITATLTCATAGITITDATETITSLAAGASITRNNAFSFTTANNVPNGTTAEFTITMVSGTSNWQHSFPLIINAPALSFGNLTISDSSGNNNGRLDPGETVTINIPLLNNGGAAGLSGTASLSCGTTGITIHTGSTSFSGIAAGGSTSLSFSLSASASMSVGSVVNLAFSAVAGAYTASTNHAVSVGLILEDYETGDFSSFDWLMEGTLPWIIDSASPYEGDYSAKSGAITANQSSTIKINRMLSSPGTLSFRYKVSSESGWDYLKFYIDGVQQSQFSGSVDWTEASYELAAGTRELKWTYSKDGSVDSGSDCAWIDYIVFPASPEPIVLYPPQNLTAIPGNGRITLNWEAPVSGSPSSYQIYKNGSLLTSVSALSYQDNAVTNSVSYSYYVVAVYPEGSSDPSNTANAVPDNITAVVIGTGTDITGTQTASPVNVYYQSLHGQSVYTAAELNTAGLTGPATITQIGFKITALPSLAMPDFTIRMAHTSSQNVATWILDDLQTVYANASYSPTKTGWNMYTLSTPFLWNGTDNILIDTAFGLIGSYTSTGQVEYTETPSGYRYGRSDSSDQTSVFSGGSISASRPNLKIAFEAVAEDEAMIAVDPGSLIYSATMAGTTATQVLRISNSGTIALTGNISTPTAFSIAQSREDASAKSERNSISFTVAAGGYRDYTVSFSPTTAGSYNGNIMITSNADNYPIMTVPTRGSSYLPPTISINSGGLSASLLIGEEGTDSFSITNTGGAELTYSIALSESRIASSGLRSANDGRSIAGSYLSIDPESYTPGTTVDWDISVYNASTDTEWIKEVILTLPEGFVINSADSLSCDTGTMAPTIDGTT